MLTLPNFLSFLRIPLAGLFFQSDPYYRAIAIILAMITDGMDGYLARKYKQTSKIGTLLDPFTDKLFVITALVVFLQEDRLTLWQAAAFMCRDLSVLIFSIYLVFKGELSRYRYGAIWSGKISTAIQLPMLFLLTFNTSIPQVFYWALIFFGMLAFVELYFKGLKQRFIYRQLEELNNASSFQMKLLRLKIRMNFLYYYSQFDPPRPS